MMSFIFFSAHGISDTEGERTKLVEKMSTLELPLTHKWSAASKLPWSKIAE